MAEYIERKKAIFPLYRWKNIIKNTYGENDEYVRCLTEAIEKIEDVPTADVAPVRHGHWKIKERGLFCSECGLPSGFIDKILVEEDGLRVGFMKIPYCPHCGTKMDGET